MFALWGHWQRQHPRRQKPKQLEYTFSQYKEKNEFFWKVDLNIDNIHYYGTGQKQRDALLNVINDNDALLRQKLNE